MAENDAESATSASIGASAATAALGGLMGSVSERWSSSGASDAVSRVSANLPQGTKDLFSSAKTKCFKREHLRSPTIFFGIGEAKPFYLEKNPALLVPRLKHNVSFFYLNYSIMTAILFVLTVLVSPSALIGMALLAFAWMSVIKSTENGELKIKGKCAFSFSAQQINAMLESCCLFVSIYIACMVGTHCACVRWRQERTLGRSLPEPRGGDGWAVLLLINDGI